MSEQRAFVVIPTHTPRYLDLVLVGLARQTRRPDRIVVSCDTDDPAIGAVIDEWTRETGLGVWWVRRPHHGVERLCQVRNNAVRHLAQALGETAGRIIVLDGDMVASDTLVAQHLALGERCDLVYPYRVDVSREESEGLDAHALLAGTQSLSVSAEHQRALAKRHRRYVKQQLMRRLGGASFGGRRAGLAPLHKPKLLGGHFSVTLECYLALNGFDELYQGWGFKDDEFAFRAARSGRRARVGVSQVIAWHLWHETRQVPGPMSDLPTAQRFAQRFVLPDVAKHGVENPLPQHPIEADFSGSDGTAEPAEQGRTVGTSRLG